MIVLNEKDINLLGIHWETLIKNIEKTVQCIQSNDFSQPIKPYLRYKNLKNRIIAMPAFVGGEIQMAGIKWIASFPENITKDIPRAHSVVILNEVDTGIPMAMIHTPLISILRTASVSGLMLQQVLKIRKSKKINLGLIGWGPIGYYHYKMCTAVFGDLIKNIYLYDIKGINESKIDGKEVSKVKIVDTWEEAYLESDVFITCTVSDHRYINLKPKQGAVLLNVSLRDYQVNVMEQIETIVVDDWEEVCRENTDIENMHLEKGLEKKDTMSLVEVVCDQALTKIDHHKTIMFNPMGMGVFDISTAAYYANLAKNKGIGVVLD
ncbi:2,3-diaminopropionate biosynthesis protein SbnB [Chengkuizengella sediminis]|uniref:2,3-diaminopropionate biosynthesis protein SbnB n=1 Tax=Chengkuizengella sediminis TaxID=1885917 RepID=UPI00138A2770|nr:2,3-diaminopropionate biosynthesis protein SbnB [Chengkuizengella sediminis]NDI35415.1 2,3-diaminopropionate biosynthesis protein SbnB [Chengkuizengella sediminis]